VTLSKAQTNNTKYLADSKELSGLCEVRSGSGLLKILSLNLSGGSEDIHAKPHSEWSGCGSSFKPGTSGTRVKFEQVKLL